LDGAITETIGEREASHIVTLCHHAAVLSRFTGDISRAKRYYEQSLVSQPNNPRALYGLAQVALEQGDTEVARRYAIQCHAALLQSEDSAIKEGLLELLTKHWPEFNP
jgi:Flp pilus assembly protein TadD